MPDTDRQAIADALGDLTDWAAAVTWADVPEAQRRRSALILLDDFAAMVAARHEPELIALRQGVARSAGKPEATVFDGGQTRLDRYSAALSNGSAADWCELDGGYRSAVCHAALYCLPALLAEAEATGARLRDLLLALLVGYETVARFAVAFVLPGLRGVVPGVIDPVKEQERLNRQLAKLDKELSTLEKKLANDKFVSNAPPEVVEQTKRDAAELADKRDQMRAAVARLA